jgi:chromosome partitioning protein
MAKVIGVVGEKGGGGKSTIAHLLGHGAGSLPQPIDAIVVTTDPNDAQVGGKRRYLAVDGRSLAALADLLRRADGEERLLVVVDGAASRIEVDEVLSGIADILVVPFGPSPQDTDRALKHLQRMKNAVALPNRWPTHPQAAQAARRWLDRVPEKRRLTVVPTINKVGGILDAEVYPQIASSVSRAGQALLLEVLYRMAVHPLELAAKRRA